MAQPPPKDPNDPADRVDLGGDPFPTLYAVRRPAGARPQVRTRIVRDVAVLDVAGQLSDVVEALDRAILLALAEAPHGVACDLSDVLLGAEADAVEMLAAVGRHPRDWPAIPVAVACPDPQVRKALSAHPLGRHLTVTASLPCALSEVLRTPTPAVERIRLMPHPTAPRASRDFVTRALLDRRLGRVIPAASLVISELVTNATLHAHTEIDLTLAWNQHGLRLTVRDRAPALPTVSTSPALPGLTALTALTGLTHGTGPTTRTRGTVPRARTHGAGRATRGQGSSLSARERSDLDLHGRGLTIVAGLARAFGVLPAADGGKVVWAVLPTPTVLRTPPAGSPPSPVTVADQEPTLDEDLA